MMFLKMFEEQDVQNIQKFRKMNVSDKLVAYIVLLKTVAITECLSRGSEQIYIDHMELSVEEAIEVFVSSNFHKNIVFREETLSIQIIDIDEFRENEKIIECLERLGVA